MLRKLTSAFIRQLHIQQISTRNLQTTGKFLFSDKNVEPKIKPKDENNKEETKAESKGKPKDDSKEKKEETNPEPEEILVLYEKDDDITLIGLCRPKQRNAINAAAAQQICEAFNKFESDETSSVGVLYGVGGSFCSGFDINELGTAADKITADLLMAPEGSVGPTRRQLKKPVVCAINGYCVANGLELALMCDLRVMEESAILGFFNRRYGVPVIDGGTVRLPAIIGYSRALDLILTGREVNAKEAVAIGLVNRIVSTGASLGQALQLACSIAKFPQASITHDRSSLYENTFMGHNFDAAIQNEVMYTSKQVILEMTTNIKKFNERAQHRGSCDNIKEISMADWEKDECAIEQETEFKENQSADERAIEEETEVKENQSADERAIEQKTEVKENKSADKRAIKQKTEVKENKSADERGIEQKTEEKKSKSAEKDKSK